MTRTPPSVGCRPIHLDAPPRTPQWLGSPGWVLPPVLLRIWALMDPMLTRKNPLLVASAAGGCKAPFPEEDAPPPPVARKRFSNLSWDTRSDRGPISSAASTLWAGRGESFMT